MTKVFIFVVLAATVTLVSQDRPSNQSTEPKLVNTGCNFSEIYRADGWKIPGVSPALAKKERLALSTIPGVFVASLKSDKSVSDLMMLECSSEPGRLVVRVQPVIALKIWKFDFNGKVFAYGAQYEPQVILKGVPHRSLRFVQILFYDIEGSGRFSVMKYVTPNLFQSLEVPEWVKANSSNMSPIKK